MAEAAARGRGEARGEGRRKGGRRGVLGWLALSVAVSVCVEWAGMTWVWPEQGAGHAQAVLEREAGYLNQDFSRAARGVGRWSGAAWHWAFEWTGLARGAVWLGEAVGAADYAAAALAMLQVVLVRVVLLVFSTPAFVLFGAVGAVWGLTLRDLRRWGAGREFGGVYHRAKRSAPRVLVAAAVVYLAMPVAVHPSAVIVPGALLFGVLVAVVTASFKKYL